MENTHPTTNSDKKEENQKDEFIIKEYDPQTSASNNFKYLFGDISQELLQKTIEKDKEHGTVVHTTDQISDDMIFNKKETVSGGQDYVRSQRIDKNQTVYFDLHTHPKDSPARFSDSDIKSMLGSLLQHPDTEKETLSNNTIRRSFGIIASPFGYPDEKGIIKLTTVDSSISDLSIEEQTQLTQDIIHDLNNKSIRLSLEEFLSEHTDLFTISRAQFTLPD